MHISAKVYKNKNKKETKKERVENPKDRQPKTYRERNDEGREKELWGRQRP